MDKLTQRYIFNDKISSLKNISLSFDDENSSLRYANWFIPHPNSIYIFNLRGEYIKKNKHWNGCSYWQSSKIFMHSKKSFRETKTSQKMIEKRP